MVTGDHAFTSEVIGKKCNIIRPGHKTKRSNKSIDKTYYSEEFNRDVEKECGSSGRISYSDKRIEAVVWNGYAEKKDMVKS